MTLAPVVGVIVTVARAAAPSVRFPRPGEGSGPPAPPRRARARPRRARPGPAPPRPAPPRPAPPPPGNRPPPPDGPYPHRNVFGAWRIRIRRAGAPPTTAFAGTSQVTTELVPITELSPTCTPRSTQAP